MVTTLLQADQSDEFFPQHSVCIYVKAIFYLYQVTRTTDNPVLKRELSQSKSAYIAAAAQSIQRFNILQRPGLLTVQALLSSVSHSTALLGGAFRFVYSTDICVIGLAHAAHREIQPMLASYLICC